MGTLAAAVRPFAGGGVPRGAAPAPSNASERVSGKKPRRVALSRDTSVCLAGVEELCVPSQKRKMTSNPNNVETAADTKVLTAGGEMSARELLQKRLASELVALRGLLKQAELISRRGGACKGGAGAPTAGGEKERSLASSKQRPEPVEDGGGGNAPSVKRRKISTLVEHKQKLTRRAPRMSPEERSQLAGRLSTLSGELPGHIVEFLLNQFGDADAHGEMEIDIDSVEDSVLFELKTQLDKFAQERSVAVDVVLPEENKDEKLLADERKSKGILEQAAVHTCGVPPIAETGSRPPPSSRSSSSDPDADGDSAYQRCSDEFPAPREALPVPEQTIATSSAQPPSEPAQVVQQSTEAKKVQDVQRVAPKAVYMPGLIYRANLRRQLLEMERVAAVLPDESIHRRDLQRLCIAEYGRPSIMRQLGLFLKADA